MVEFQATKQVQQSQQKPKYGSFSQYPVLKWENCREQFSRVFPKGGFYFSHEDRKGDNIAAFLLKIESILGLRKKSQFAKTNLDFVLWVCPSKFWMSCNMRKSLFTLFLRAGSFYSLQEDNFQQALLLQPYIAATKNAVYRFLFGFTKFQGEQNMALGAGRGWVYYFRNKSDMFICDKLVSRTKGKIKIGYGVLWS